MQLYKTKLWIPYSDILVPPKTQDGKNTCFYFFGENVEFFDVFNFLNIKKNFVKYYFYPTIVKPFRSAMNPEEKKEILSYGLRPIRDFLGNYQKVEGKNFYFDGSRFLNVLDKRYRIDKYNVGKAPKLYTNYLNTLTGVDSNKYNKFLLYAVNIDKYLPKRIQYRKFFILYMMLLKWQKQNIELPFDKILLFFYNKDGGRYVKLFDKEEKNNNISRIRNIILKLQTSNQEETKENDIDLIANTSSKESDIVDRQHESKISNAVKQYMKADSTLNNINSSTILSPENQNKLINRSLIYNVTGNLNTTNLLSKKLSSLPKEQQKKVIDNLTPKILEKGEAKSTSTNMIVSMADPAKMVDKLSPDHILNKRRQDFDVLKEDIYNSFKMLENKDIPLYLVDMKIKTVKSGPSELYQTEKDRIFVTLKDSDGNLHEVFLDIPHLSENNTFLINSLQKVLINQLIRFPVFFMKDSCRIESSYSVIKILSKQLRSSSYFQLFLGSYKLPLIEVLAYMEGFDNVMKQYGINYTISSKPE